MEWIKIEDQKPKNGQAVIVYQTWQKDTMFSCLARPLNRCFYYIAEYQEYNECFVNRLSEPFINITHWMPLPPKPTKETT